MMAPSRPGDTNPSSKDDAELPLIAGMSRKLSSRLLAAAWLVLASYCLMSVTLGEGGFLATASLHSEIAGMRDNLAKLESLNAELQTGVAALRSDPDRARREARSLGWLAKNEYEIVLANHPVAPVPKLETGKALLLRPPISFADKDLKATSLLIGLAAFAGMVLRGRMAGAAPRRRRKSSPTTRAMKANRPAGEAATAERPGAESLAS